MEGRLVLADGRGGPCRAGGALQCHLSGHGRYALAQRPAGGAGDYAAVKAAFTVRQPIGRLGRAEEIADLVVYLAGATYTTGQIHNIDGGWSI